MKASHWGAPPSTSSTCCPGLRPYREICIPPSVVAWRRFWEGPDFVRVWVRHRPLLRLRGIAGDSEVEGAAISWTWSDGLAAAIVILCGFPRPIDL